MDNYSPTNSPASCPATSANWSAEATPLPPTPNAQLCSCMTASLDCIVNPNTNSNNYAAIFNYVCGKDPKACDGINAFGNNATYGAYSMCDDQEQLSFVINQYYLSQNKASTACNFKGQAKLQNAGGSSSQCSALLQQAGSAGTGTVTSAPSGTGAAPGTGGSAASSKGAAALLAAPSAENGLLPMAFIVTIAAFSGMGMMLL